MKDLSFLSYSLATISLLAVCHALLQLVRNDNKRTKSGDVSAITAVITMITAVIINAIK